MTTSPLPRRAIVGAVLATSLIGGGLAMAFADDAAPAGGCATWTDPKGDSNTFGEPTGTFDDANLDIVAASASTTADSVVATLTTDAMTEGPSDAGDEFGLDLTVAGADLYLAADRDVDPTADPTGPGGSIVSAYIGNYADPTVAEDATAKFDVKAKTVTITAKVTALKAAAAADVAGKPITGLSAYTADIAPQADVQGFIYDDAAGKGTLTVGTDCAGGAVPAAGAPAPSASPSAEPAPQPSPSAAPAPGGAPAAPGLPAAGCNTLADPKGDAVAFGPEGNDPDLDLTGLVLQSTPDTFRAILRVDKLGTRALTGSGHAFYTYFTVNKKAVYLLTTAYDPAQFGEAQDGAADGTAGLPASVNPTTRLSVDGKYVPSGIKSTFDTKTSMVTLSIPRAELAKAVGGFDDGAVLTAVYGRDSTTNPVAGGFFVDSTTKDNATGVTAADTWTVGDNKCFAPPAPPLSSVGAVKAQYGDIAAVAAKLVDAAGAPVAGKTVTFTLGASKASGVTGADGIAKGALVVKDKAGKRTLAITSDDAKASVPFTVLVEKTALKAVGSKGTVTATLTDDDKKPVAGQVVTFTSGSKKLTAKTNAKGVAKVSGLPAGNIKVTYAGATGMYTAASTTTKA